MRYRFADVTLDTRAGSLTRTGRIVPLEPRAFEVLCLLVRRPGELIDHQTLIDCVWAGVNVTPHSLTEAISQLRRALDDRSREPRIIETAHRRGYRFIADVECLPDRGGMRWRLPARIVELFGRDADLDAVASRMTQHRLLTLVGPGGVGKTQLALEAARRVESSVPGGAQLIDLAPATRAADVYRIVAGAVGVPEGRDVDLAASIASILRDTHALFVLDNCERVADVAGGLAERILSSASAMRILATSQRPLGATGEALFRVAPLECTGGSATGTVSPAVRLFAARAAAVAASFDGTGAHAPVIRQICERLDGLPLAIELAAARTRILSPAQILERLDSRFELLGESHLAGEARHRTLSAVIEWSTSLLDPLEDSFLQDVSVFPGPWDLDGAAAVSGAHDAGTVLPRLAGLIDKSLVLAETAGEQASYRLLDSVRLFASRRLGESQRYDTVGDRMLAHYVDLSEQTDREWHGANVRWIERLRTARPNLRAAMEWTLRTPARAALGLRMGGNLRWFWR